MSFFKKIIKSGINKLGYQIRPKEKTNNISDKFFDSKFDDVSYYITPIGKYYLPNNRPTDVVIAAMQKGLFFESYIIDTAKEFIKPGTSVLDLGANFGQMSIEFSKLTGDTGKIYSFEADPFIYDLLEKNIHANNCNNVKLVYGAVLDKDNTEVFYPVPDFKRFGSYGSYGIDLTAKEGRKIPTLTIDSIEFENEISFMKVDIQGSDLFAMRGAVNTIKKHRMPILFEFEQQLQKEFSTCFQDYVEFTASINYKFERIIGGINFLIVPK